MIVFDLQCSARHVFEAWFGSSAAYDEQRARGLLACPICGDAAVTKAVMAPNIPAKGNRATNQSTAPAAVTVAANAPSPKDIKAALQVIAKAQAEMLAQSTWVGRGFADTARAMHDGTVAQAPIHGQTTLAEAKALVEEGVPIAPLPLPIAPPETVN
ncbi:DUF1178 family protein [Sphingomonas sp. PAMC 26617]|uniref:DUF1178 family protein n=1 Tax=Sphingomonas sp. PAMC 26617 TaxID=1112216 RepID=UPI000289C0DC|nr:DUF1178 family protein [Sphingomonas sp. PAMC 26617]